ncbi:hypothetical protein PEC18_02055 [Paucibacter sp. O1-1]|nr:hypothetical protein [Paucibacter sp. O1-1]MDA3824672.1 hypothetical protein [Paucibacter sp. O1-1]
MIETVKSLRAALVAAGLAALAGGALADFELKDEQGRRILLKDDGSWRYVDAAAPAAPAASAAPAKPLLQAELRLERRVEAPGGCRFELALSNKLDYEIRSVVPDFTVLRANDVAYMTQLTGFGPVRPGDEHRRALQFAGIGCGEIAKLQVHGGDRCEMGELNKFTESKGACLALLKVLPSDLLPFEKKAETPAKK